MQILPIVAAWLATLAVATGAHSTELSLQADFARLAPVASIAPAVVSPRWITRPDADQIARVVPGIDLAPGQSARAVTECRADASGHLSNCVVLAEAPRRIGAADAALALMPYFEMQPISEEGLPTLGALVRITIDFAASAAAEPAPALFVAAGDEAYLVNRSAEGDPVGRIGCPTRQEPRRRCYLHALRWAATPNLVDRAALLRTIGRTEGRSLVDCAVDRTGALTDCDASADMVSPKKEALFALLANFRAPAAALDRQPVASGRVLIGFDWLTLNRAANVSTLTANPVRPLALTALRP